MSPPYTATYAHSLEVRPEVMVSSMSVPMITGIAVSMAATPSPMAAMPASSRW